MPRLDTSAALTQTAADPSPAALHASPWQIQRVLCGRDGVVHLRDESPRVLSRLSAGTYEIDQLSWSDAEGAVDARAAGQDRPGCARCDRLADAEPSR